MGEMSYLSPRQEAVIALVPIVPAMASIAGSVTILRLVGRAKFQRPYQRILFGMSLYDIFNSITVVLQSFLVPSESRRRWSVGNKATCSMLGFFFQFSYPSFMYFGFLSFYYMLSIRFSMSDEIISRRVEPWMHALAIGYPTVTAIVGAALDLYGEVRVGAGCWLAESTALCDSDCMKIVQWIFGGLPFVTIFVSIVVNNIVIAWHVRSTISRSFRWSSNQETQQQKVRAVANQAFLYVAVFFLTYVWTIILRFMSNQGSQPDQEPRVYPVMVLRALFLPIMGVCTVLVYSRPRYLQLRSVRHNVTRLGALRSVLFDTEDCASSARDIEQPPPLGARQI